MHGKLFKEAEVRKQAYVLKTDHNVRQSKSWVGSSSPIHFLKIWNTSRI